MHCGSLETARKCMVWLWGIQEAWCSDLLGTHCTSPFHLPSATEFMLLETRKIGGSTKKNFRVQLMGSLACWWNCCAANIFSRAYVKKNGNRFKHEAWQLALTRIFKHFGTCTIVSKLVLPKHKWTSSTTPQVPDKCVGKGYVSYKYKTVRLLILMDAA